MSWLASVWHRAVMAPEDARVLGLVRVVLVGVFTLSMLAHVGAVDTYFSEASPLAGKWARQAFYSRWSIFLWVTRPLAVQAMFALGVVAHVCWCVGLFTVPASLVALVVYASMMGRNPLLYSLPDHWHMVLMLLLVLLPTGRGLSLDAKWRGKSGPVPVWCRRVVQLQLALMYVATGLEKSGTTWLWDGTAIYYAAVNPYNRHADLSFVLAWLQPLVLRPTTIAVYFFEASFGGFVLVHWLRELGVRRVPDLRWVFWPFGWGMHLGIQCLLYVAWFSPLTMGCYLAFLAPDELQRVTLWLRRWLPQGFTRTSNQNVSSP